MDSIALARTCGVSRQLVLRATLFALLLGVSPCAEELHAESAGVTCRPHVEILRGLGGYMPGVRRLQEKLAACGISSTTTCSECSWRVSRRILDRRSRGDCSPIVLLGYATAGGGTMRVADDVAEQGIIVDAVILIDPSFFEPVRQNVRYCFVAYNPVLLQKWNPIMRGEPVRVESCRTVVNKVNLEENDPHGMLNGHNHLTITTSDWVQKILVCQAVSVFGCHRNCKGH